MNTNTPTTANNTNETPRVSFTAYPLGAWLVCIVAASIFLLLSHHEERIAIWNIFVAGSMAVCTVGGTVYALILLALKRYPRFKTSLILGAATATACIAAGIATAMYLNRPALSFAMMAAFILISAVFPLFMRLLRQN